MSNQKLKINIASFLELFKLKFTESLWNYLFKKSGAIVMTLFVIVSIISGFLAYKYLYSSGWSESRKKDYLMEEKKSETNFSLEKFEKIIQRIEKRDKNFEKTKPLDVKDIFRF